MGVTRIRAPCCCLLLWLLAAAEMPWSHKRGPGVLATAASPVPGASTATDPVSGRQAASIALNDEAQGFSTAAAAVIEAPSREQSILWHQQLQERVSAAASTTRGTSQELLITSKQERLMLQRHNLYRAAHKAQPLTWNAQLAADASAWASQCRYEHDPLAAAGDNLFFNSLADYSQLDRQALLSVDLWYSEEYLYDYDKPGFSKETGHFTQLVWQETTEIGCGIHMCFDGISGGNPPLTARQGTVVVCRYSLAGNAGRYAQNVLSRTYVPNPPTIVDAIQPPNPNDKPHDSPNYAPLATQRLLAAGGSTTGCRYSPNNRYKLCLLEDSRLVLYKLTTAVWVSSADSQTTGRPFQLRLQPNGVLTVRSSKTSNVVWRAGTPQGAKGRYQLALSNTGALTVDNKSNNKVIWQAQASK